MKHAIIVAAICAAIGTTPALAGNKKPTSKMSEKKIETLSTKSSGQLSKEGHQVAFSAATIMLAIILGN